MTLDEIERISCIYDAKAFAPNGMLIGKMRVNLGIEYETSDCAAQTQAAMLVCKYMHEKYPIVDHVLLSDGLFEYKVKL